MKGSKVSSLFKIIVLLLYFFFLFSHAVFCQQDKIRIGVLTRNMDTTFTHLYVDMVKSLNKLHPHDFNLTKYYQDNMQKEFPDEDYTFVKVKWQTMFNKFNFYNINGAPSKKCKQWLDSITIRHNLNFLLFLDAKTVLSSSNFSGLNSNSYGIATFYQNAEMISLYAMVWPRIYSLQPGEEIKIPREKMPYLSNTFLLDREDKLSLKEIELVTPEYYSMAVDSIKYYTDGQIKLISKALKKAIATDE